MNKILKRVEEDYTYKRIVYRQLSRWINIDYKEVTSRHRLFDYADPYDCEEGRAMLTYFRFRGQEYSLGQFMRFSYGPGDTDDIHLEDGTRLVAYDATDSIWPLLLELDERIPAVRLWREEVAS